MQDINSMTPEELHTAVKKAQKAQAINIEYQAKYRELNKEKMKQYQRDYKRRQVALSKLVLSDIPELVTNTK